MHTRVVSELDGLEKFVRDGPRIEGKIFVHLRGFERLFTEHLTMQPALMAAVKELLSVLAQQFSDPETFTSDPNYGLRARRIGQVVEHAPPEYCCEIELLLRFLAADLGTIAQHGSPIQDFNIRIVRYLRQFVDEIK